MCVCIYTYMYAFFLSQNRSLFVMQCAYMYELYTKYVKVYIHVYKGIFTSHKLCAVIYTEKVYLVCAQPVYINATNYYCYYHSHNN